MTEGTVPAIQSSPWPLFCAAGLEQCALVNRVVLILTDGIEEWHEIAAGLDALGLRVRASHQGHPSSLVPGEPVDLVVLHNDFDADAAFVQVDALVADRPWVPLLVRFPGDLAVRINIDPVRMLPQNRELALGVQPLRRLVAQALCRTARHQGDTPGCLGSFRVCS